MTELAILAAIAYFCLRRGRTRPAGSTLRRSVEAFREGLRGERPWRQVEEKRPKG